MAKRTTFTTAWIGSPQTRLIVFIGFLACVFFMGGGSRADIQSLIILRPLAIVSIAYCLTISGGPSWAGRCVPLYMILTLVVIMTLQLIPLPPAIWTSLPERHIFADIAVLSGMDQPWRPLSLSPSGTINSLFSLSIPLAAIMLYLNLDRKDHRKAMLALIIMLLISAIWGMFQIMGSSRGPLYLYRITNHALPVGLFSNRNHQAVILAFLISLIGWYIGSENRRRGKPSIAKNLLGTAILALIPLIFLVGSRAGLILMVPAIFAALYFILMGANSSWSFADRDKRFNPAENKKQWLLLAGLLFGAISISALSIFFSRSLAFERLFAVDTISGLRVRLVPTLFEMWQDFWVLGSGFGSFEHIYKIYEPLDLLKPTYLNHAHNDYFQVAIEGGLPVLLLVAILLVWVVRRIVTLFRKGEMHVATRNNLLICLFLFGIIAVASIGDYPLRVPSIMVLAAVFTCMFDTVTSGSSRERDGIRHKSDV